MWGGGQMFRVHPFIRELEGPGYRVSSGGLPWATRDHHTAAQSSSTLRRGSRSELLEQGSLYVIFGSAGSAELKVVELSLDLLEEFIHGL